MNSAPMHLSILSEADNIVSLKLSGKVTQRNVALTLDPLDETMGTRGLSHPLLLDLSGVELLDSSGVNWLLVSQKRVRESGGRMVLHSLSPIARNVLRVLNMHTVFAMADNESHAQKIANGAGT